MCLPMYGAQVPSQVQDDASASKPMGHNYWACALEPGSHKYGSPRSLEPVLQTREATAVRSLGTAAATRESPLTTMKTQHKQSK